MNKDEQIAREKCYLRSLQNSCDERSIFNADIHDLKALYGSIGRLLVLHAGSEPMSETHEYPWQTPTEKALWEILLKFRQCCAYHRHDDVHMPRALKALAQLEKDSGNGEKVSEVRLNEIYGYLRSSLYWLRS